MCPNSPQLKIHWGELEYYSLLVRLSGSDEDLEPVVSLGWILRAAQTNDKLLILSIVSALSSRMKLRVL
jgi:hypothetical protein